MLILPDSSCWIEYFRPRGDADIQTAIQTWLGTDSVALCGPVRAEVLRGAPKREVAKVRRAFSALRYLETSDNDWDTVAEAARVLSNDGHHVPLLDVLVAVIASRVGVTLAHKDTHFNDLASVVSFSTHSFL